MNLVAKAVFFVDILSPTAAELIPQALCIVYGRLSVKFRIVAGQSPNTKFVYLVHDKLLVNDEKLTAWGFPCTLTPNRFDTCQFN